MIRTFADKETERVWDGRLSRRLPSDIQAAALRKLRLLNRAAAVEELRIPPGNRLEQLHGDREGRYSIRINGQWRITLAGSDGGADGVRIGDYHR